MNTADLLVLFDRPIAFHPGFVELTGSVNAALMLSQAFYWTRRVKPEADGWFYKSQEEWTKEIRLTRREQEGARKLLRATGFWKEHRKGNPAKMFYKIDLDAFQMKTIGETSVQSRMALFAIDESPEAPDLNGENSHTPRARPNDPTETTSKTTNPNGTRLPEDFWPDPAMIAWARHDTPLVDVKTATEEFKDYWKGIPGVRGRKLDWPATWRNRMRELQGRAAARGHRPQQTSKAGESVAAAKRVAETLRK